MNYKLIVAKGMRQAITTAEKYDLILHSIRVLEKKEDDKTISFDIEIEGEDEYEDLLIIKIIYTEEKI